MTFPDDTGSVPGSTGPGQSGVRRVLLHSEALESHGPYDLQLFRGKLVVHDGRGGQPLGNRPLASFELDKFPPGQWVPLEDLQGNAMPIRARWDGVRLEAEIGQDVAAREPSHAKSKFSAEGRFVAQDNKTYSHPEGGMLLTVHRSYDRRLDELQVQLLSTQTFLTWPLGGLPQGEFGLMRLEDNTPLPGAVRR